MYLMVRIDTDPQSDEQSLLLGLRDMVDDLRREGYDALVSNKVGWNIVIYGVHTTAEVEDVWQFAEERGAYGYVPPELLN